MCGIDFVSPFQGSNLFLGHETQGVALGYPVKRFQRVTQPAEPNESKTQKIMTNAGDLIVDALEIESFMPCERGLKAPNMTAQGNALGPGVKITFSPERA
jgi:hypothetical protein